MEGTGQNKERRVDPSSCVRAQILAQTRFERRRWGTSERLLALRAQAPKPTHAPKTRRISAGYCCRYAHPGTTLMQSLSHAGTHSIGRSLVSMRRRGCVVQKSQDRRKRGCRAAYHRGSGGHGCRMTKWAPPDRGCRSRTCVGMHATSLHRRQRKANAGPPVSRCVAAWWRAIRRVSHVLVLHVYSGGQSPSWVVACRRATWLCVPT